jgi:P27 family predicted phage terminase small subunit
MRRVPTRLKILRGDRKGTINRLEPQAPAARVEDIPDYLTGLAVEKWRELFPVLNQVAVLTETDREALARYCDLYRYWREVRQVIIDQGCTYPVVNDKGEIKYIAQRPEVSIHRGLVQQLRQLEGDFGLNPTSRAGLKVAQPHEADPLDEFFAPAVKTKR